MNRLIEENQRRKTVYTLFDTEIGRCAIAWREPENPDETLTVTGFQLPEASVQIAKDKITGKEDAVFSSKIPPQIERIIGRVKSHFRGKTEDFADIPLDYGQRGPFTRRVYEAARKIPPGKTATYGELAQMAGSPGAARAVGQAMRSNPVPLIVPCHRVIASGNRPGGFSAYGGLAVKRKMLQIEGVSL